MNITILNGWNFWSFTSWTSEETSAFWTALGAIGTVGTLIYVLIDSRKNRKKINDLGEIAKELKEQTTLLSSQAKLTTLQLKEAALPLLIVDELQVKNSSVWLYFRNDGQRLTITKMTDRIGDFELMTSGSSVLPGQKYVIYCTPIDDKKLEDCKFSITIEYEDIYGNSYSINANGSGETLTSFTDPKSKS